MNEDLDLTLYTDAPELVAATTTEIMELVVRSLAEKKICHIALTGGTLGTDIARALVARINTAGDLSGLHIWLSDERFVESNSDLLNAAMLKDLRNDSVIFHPALTASLQISVADAADDYNKQLQEAVMDLCLLGVGPDGHVASLFPGHWDQVASSKVIAVGDSPKPPSERISFSMNFINQSQQVWIIAAGDSKAEAVTQLLEADPQIPASHVEATQLTRLIVDTEAFFAESL